MADNGGITVAASPAGAVTVGFLPSFLLRFSPLARSTDGGTSWSSGLLPAPLAATPDALAEGPAGAFAVVGAGAAATGAGGQRTVRLAHRDHDPRPGPDGDGLHRAADHRRGAGGVGLGPGPVLGVQCAQPGRIGVLARSAGSPGAGGRGRGRRGRASGRAWPAVGRAP